MELVIRTKLNKAFPFSAYILHKYATHYVGWKGSPSFNSIMKASVHLFYFSMSVITSAHPILYNFISKNDMEAFLWKLFLIFTSAESSKLPNRSLRVSTKSDTFRLAANNMELTISAYKMLNNDNKIAYFNIYQITNLLQKMW